MTDPRECGIFFFHNPKAGGTSIQRAIQPLFAADDICPLIENSEHDHRERGGEYRRFRGYRFYAGHYGSDIFESVDAGHLPITNFRHPIARLLSLYNYYRYHVTLPDNPSQRDALYPVAVAKQADFRHFVGTQDPRIEILTRNHHARQLTRSAWTPGSSGDLAQALALVARMEWFYVCEHPDLSMRWARRVFGEGFPAIGYENVTSSAAEHHMTEAAVDAGTRRVILEKNALDLALHRYAEMRLRNQGN